MGEFFKNVIALQTELKVPKDKQNTFGGYKYRSCEAILEAVKPLLKKYGLLLNLTDEVVMIGDRYYVQATATLFDASGSGAINSKALARESDVKKGMDPSQVTGASSSYARKYALNGLLCIDDTKDPDTDEFTKQTRTSKKEKETPDTISFGTAPEVEPETKDAALPFSLEGTNESIELRGLLALMKQDDIKEDQILSAFRGKYDSIHDIEPEVIQEKLLDKWAGFIKYVKGGKN